MENAIQTLERKIKEKELQINLIIKQVEIAKKVSYNNFVSAKKRLQKQQDLLIQMKQKYNLFLNVNNLIVDKK